MRTNDKIIKWRRLGGGGFNKTYVSTEPFPLTINGITYHQHWVLKVPLAHSDCELNRKMNAPSRAVRIWNSLHSYSPAIECPELGGWLAPYKGSIAATDEEIALQQLEDYRLYRRIFADACGDHNYLNVNGKIECIDVDVSYQPNSPIGKRANDEVIRLGKKDSPYNDYWHDYATFHHRPKSVQMTKTLLYIEQQINAKDILDHYLIPEVIEKLHPYQRNQYPISSTLLKQFFEQVQLSKGIGCRTTSHTRFFKMSEQTSKMQTNIDIGNSCTIN